MRILLLQTSFLGDVVLSTPVISALRRKFPDAELWMMTTPEARGLVERDPELKGVLTFDKNGKERSLTALLAKARELRALNFDRAYALQRSARTALLLCLARIPYRIGFESARLNFLYHERQRRDPSKHDVLRNLQILGLHENERGETPSPLRVVLPGDESISAKIREVIATHPGAVVLVPGSAWATKRWDWRGYHDLAKRFIRAGMPVILVGSPAERELAGRVAGNLGAINLAGESTIPELAWVISKAAVVVCNDSMSLHLASAAKVPTVALFCATSPQFGFGPWENNAKVLEVDGLSCKPCSRHGATSCPTGTWACTRELLPEQVFKAAQEIIRKS